MDSTYLVAGIAVAVIAVVFAWYEVDRLKKEIVRHQAAAVKFRSFVATQKYALASAIVERLNLKEAVFPGVDVALYSKICDLYDSPELLPYAMPVEARAEYDIYWTRASFDDLELFTLWLEGIIEHGKNEISPEG